MILNNHEQFAGILHDKQEWYNTYYKNSTIYGSLIDQSTLFTEIDKHNINDFMMSPVGIYNYEPIAAKSFKSSILDLSNIQMLLTVFKQPVSIDGVVEEFFIIRGVPKL